jgi:glycosyltransferase involved in cell wall biosynthesis
MVTLITTDRWSVRLTGGQYGRHGQRDMGRGESLPRKRVGDKSMGVQLQTIATAESGSDRVLVDNAVRDREATGLARPKRVAFLTWWVRGGGPGWSQYYYMKNLDRRQIEPVAVLPSRGIFGDKLDELGIEVVLPEKFPETLRHNQRADSSFVTRNINAIRNGWNLLGLIPRLARVFKERNIDLVYCNEIGMAFVGAPAAQLAGVPCVVHVRGLDDPTTPWNALWKAIGFPISRAVAHLPAVRTVIANSAATDATFSGRLRRKVQVVHNGVDLGDFDPARVRPGTLRAELGIDRDVTVIGFTGHTQPRKGIDVLIHAAERVLAAREKVAFVIVGDNQVGSTVDHRARYEQMARETGISDRFIFAGFRDDVRPALADFDVHCMPSYQEAFGRSLIEAMALGCPVVASRVGGIPEVIGEERHGILVPPADSDALAQALLRLVDNPPLRAELGEAGRTRVRRNFDVAELTRQMDRLLLRSAGSPVVSVQPAPAAS